MKETLRELLKTELTVGEWSWQLARLFFRRQPQTDPPVDRRYKFENPKTVGFYPLCVSEYWRANPHAERVLMLTLKSEPELERFLRFS